jgi:hypothetical protein
MLEKLLKTTLEPTQVKPFFGMADIIHGFKCYGKHGIASAGLLFTNILSAGILSKI